MFDAAASDPGESEWPTRAPDTSRSGLPTSGWYVSGRAELNRQIAEFLAEGQGVLVVSGAAASGKSTLIDRAVTLTDPTLRGEPAICAAVESATEGTVPAIGSIDVAVLARQKGTAHVAEDLVRAYGEVPRLPEPRVSRIAALRCQLEELIGGRGGTTMVVDGLDESTEPSALLTDLLGPLLRLASEGRPLVRMVVGVRSVHDSDPDPVGLVHLLERVAGKAEIQHVHTDGPGTHADIVGYLESLLATGPYRNLPDQRTKAAQVIADIATPSFLTARLAAEQLLQNDFYQDLADEQWRTTLSRGAFGLLRADIERVAESQEEESRLLAVLQAAAFALGDGVPRAEIWPAMIEAVPDAEVPDADDLIRRVLGGRLGVYLTREVVDEHIVYRPVHDLLSRALRGADETGAHRRVATRLAELARRAPTMPPHPYLRRHLVDHAHLGDVLDDHHVPARILPFETGGRLREYVGLPIVADEHRWAVTTWATIEPLIAGENADIRRASFRVAYLADHQRPVPPDDSHGPGAGSDGVAPLWSRWENPGNIVGKCGKPVKSVALAASPDGRLLLASGSYDETVRVWDPVTGRPVGAPLTGHTDKVTSVAFGTSREGRLLLASCVGDESVRLWDPEQGGLIAKLIVPGGVEALATTPAAPGLLAIGGAGGLAVVSLPRLCPADSPTSR